MSTTRGISFALISSLCLIGLFLFQLSHTYRNPYPHITTSLESPQTDLQDVGGIVLGLRRLGADLAWIQTLQYYGTQEPGQSEFEFENGLGNYPQLFERCKRVTQIDPYFTEVYDYCGSALTWNLDRLSEGEELLKEGIAKNPTDWRLAQYLAAMAYQKNHDVKNLLIYLETIAKDPQSPFLMKAILANLYKKQHLFDKALQLWVVIYETGTPDYQNRALDKIREISRLKHTPSLDKETPI